MTTLRELEVLRRLNPDLEDLSQDNLWRAFTALSQRDEDYKAWFRTFTTERPLPELFKASHSPGYEVTLAEHSDLYTGELVRTIERGDLPGGERNLRGEFGFFKNQAQNVWTAFTSEDRDFFEKGLSRYLESHRPTATPSYSTSEELRRILASLEGQADGYLTVQKAVLYSHDEEGEITFKKRPFRNLFNTAQAQRMYVDKVEFTLENRGELLLHAFLSRDGVSYFYGGEASLLRTLFLPQLVKTSQQKSDLLRGRARSEPSDETKPIEVVFDRPALESREDNERFINALSSLPRGSLAVFHDNPYLHASFLDLNDGSSYEVFVTDQNRISILPNFRSSVYSLSRVLEGIFREFQEGEVEDPESPDYQMEDFLSTA